MPLLSSQQRQRYEEDGYLTIPNLLNDRDLAPVRRAIMRHVSQEAKRLSSEGEIQDLHERLPFTRRLKEVYRSLNKRTIGWNQEVFSEEIYDFGVHRAILDGLRSAGRTGNTVQRRLLGTYKAAGGNRDGLPLASGQRLLYGDPTEFHILSLWIPLVDVDEHNGCMQVLPGSHRWGLRPVESDDEGHHIPTEDIESRGEIVTLPMKAGDIFACHNLTFHRSLMNQSDDIRWSIDLRYSEIGRPLEWLFKAGLNGFIARSHEHPETVDSWVDWQTKRRAAGVKV